MKTSQILPILLGISLLAFALPQSALAQKGGVGGGSTGGGGAETGIPFSFTYAAKINGSLPAWSGTYVDTPGIPGYYSYETLQVSLKGKPMNLPDGTQFSVTIYSHDALTGLDLPIINAPRLSVVNKVGSEKSLITLLNPPYTAYERVINGVIITAADGTLVAACTG